MGSNDTYIPGTCNIGRAEIQLRRRIAWSALAITIIAWGLLALLKVAGAWRLALFFPATLAAAGFLQAAWHFCAKFGLLGVLNFGPKAFHTEAIERADFRRQDRRTAIKIIGLALLIGAAIAITAYLLPF